MTATSYRIDHYPGPIKCMHDRNRRIVIQFGRFPDCEELSPDWYASAIGWGSCLIASCPDLETLASYVEERFGSDRIAIAKGEEFNPCNWPEANW